MRKLLQTGIKDIQNGLHISDHTDINDHVLVDLCRIHIHLNDLCLLGEILCHTGDTVGKSGPQHNEHIGLTNA